MFLYLVCSFALFSCGVFSDPLVPSPCSRDDTRCITSLVQVMLAAPFQGSSDLKPIFHERIDVSLPTLVFTLFDTSVMGFDNCQIKDASISPDKTSLHTLMFCPRFDFIGQYEANGILGKVPFNGKGGFTLGIADYNIALDLKLESTIRDDKKYIKITDFNAEGELQGELDFKLENLNGNKELSDAAHKYIHENQKAVMDILQKPVLDAYLVKVLDVLNKSYENFSVDGLVP